MIPVTQQNEPVNFDELVRQPGQKYLETNPKPSTEEFNKHAYWGRISDQLRQSYRGICAYSCQHINVLTGNSNVEHFQPKSIYHDQAYEWGNYRFVCGTLNSRKRTRTILDPFLVEEGWFCIIFPSLLVCPGEGLQPAVHKQVQDTIDILRLNDDEICIPARRRYIDLYCCGDVHFSYLEKDAPFVAQELERQGMKEKIKEIWICALPSRSQPLF